jgi:hypothetical protein
MIGKFKFLDANDLGKKFHDPSFDSQHISIILHI